MDLSIAERMQRIELVLNRQNQLLVQVIANVHNLNRSSFVAPKLQTVDPNIKQQQWYDTSSVILELGLTKPNLLAIRKSGRLGKCGDAWRLKNSKNDAKRPSYMWNKARCEYYLSSNRDA